MGGGGSLFTVRPKSRHMAISGTGEKQPSRSAPVSKKGSLSQIGNSVFQVYIPKRDGLLCKIGGRLELDLKFGATQSSQLFSPGQFRCFWWNSTACQWSQATVPSYLAIWWFCHQLSMLDSGSGGEDSTLYTKAEIVELTRRCSVRAFIEYRRCQSLHLITKPIKVYRW